MRRILITGVTGTIGRHLTETLLQADNEIVGVAVDVEFSLKHAKLTYQSLDITDYEAVDHLFTQRGIDTLIHLAALVHVRDPHLSFGDYSRLNYRASEHLFQKATAAGVRRTIFASTVEVYGPISEKRIVSESTPCQPDTDYARTKLLAEEALESVTTDSDFRHAILRFAPVYSREFRLNLDKRLYLRTPTIGYYVGRGDYELSLCSIRNISHFVTKWLELDMPMSGVFNLADEHSYPIKDVLRRERDAGRCAITLPLPYTPCLAAVSLLEVGMKLAGRTSGMLAVENVRKLKRSTVWDVSHARAAVGSLPWNLQNTLDHEQGQNECALSNPPPES